MPDSIFYDSMGLEMTQRVLFSLRVLIAVFFSIVEMDSVLLL